MENIIQIGNKQVLLHKGLTKGGLQALNMESETGSAVKEPVRVVPSAICLAWSRNPRNGVRPPDSVTGKCGNNFQLIIHKPQRVNTDLH